MVSATHDGALGLGARVVTVRRLGKREQTMTLEMTGYDAPHSWSLRGVDGPVRALVTTRIEPLDDGARSRVTIELDFEGHGIGKVLVPLLVRPESRQGLPRNLELLRISLEG
ncbi:SRPBCC family protein [Nocardioides sp. WL0053]|uniref:SRPBCC family protein n=1 Tax=Nocardioides jiangsuensis TaxID=2866161 RepID=A0ABS7RI01_9ACTN|nr:SRPBCC family protein [Nocardioides jiangsuensis]MBY9074139.1 SRPBCC family protein [Nocardioides jiangsuensis]